MKKLEDIMGYYELKDEDILGKEPLSAAEKERILQKIIVKAESKKIPPKSHKKRFIMLVAACITVFALGAVSFAATTLNVNFLNFFHPQNQEETNLLKNLGTVINKQVTENGLTLDIKEAIGDSNAVYVLFDIIAPKDTVLDKYQYTFVSKYIDINKNWGMPHGMGYSFQCLEDVNPSDNVKPMMLCLSSSQKLIGKNMTFRFTDFSCYKTEEELKNLTEAVEGTLGDENDLYNILIPGKWEITFPLNYADNTKVYKLDEKLQYNNILFTVKEIRLSPISISMTLSTLLNNRTDSIHEAPLIIHLKNGETIDASDGSRGTTTDSFNTVVDAQFTKIVNPSEIESIEYCGTILPIKL